MDTWKGTTAGNMATSSVYNLSLVIESFTLVNMTGGGVTANVYLIDQLAHKFCISPLNQTIDAAEMYENERNIVVLATEQINVQTSGAVDYNFTLRNIEP